MKNVENIKMNVFVKIEIMKKCIMNNAKNYQKLKKTSMIIEKKTQGLKNDQVYPNSREGVKKTLDKFNSDEVIDGNQT